MKKKMQKKKIREKDKKLKTKEDGKANAKRRNKR